jgi:hypothetical protein
MSRSTTQTEPTSVHQILRVYDVHQTGGGAPSQTSGWSLETQWPAQPQLRDWTLDYHRVPPYREPIRSQYFDRPAGRDAGEATFVVMMFSGVYVVSVRRIPGGNWLKIITKLTLRDPSGSKQAME